MDIVVLDAALSTVSAYDIGSSQAMLHYRKISGCNARKIFLDMTQTLGAGMVQMMENSVTPYLEVISILYLKRKSQILFAAFALPTNCWNLCDFKNFYENFRLTFPLHLAILILVKAS